MIFSVFFCGQNMNVVVFSNKMDMTMHRLFILMGHYLAYLR